MCCQNSDFILILRFSAYAYVNEAYQDFSATVCIYPHRVMYVLGKSQNFFRISLKSCWQHCIMAFILNTYARHVQEKNGKCSI